MADIKRKLATIEKILEIHPIDGADAIERVVVRGWNVVVKKGEFSVGDLCVYFEIDSLLPIKEEFEFLRKSSYKKMQDGTEGFRLRTIKLRGQISQGIIFPLSILPKFIDKLVIKPYPGLDVTDIVGVVKYEAPIPAQLSGQVKGSFPSHSIKTDEERIQNLIEEYEDFRKDTWIATEKLDGTSSTFSIYEDVFGISSRNLELIETNTNTYWKVARELNIEEKMREYMKTHNMEALTIQGEMIGEGIQKNLYKIKGQTVKFFRVFDPITYQFIPLDSIVEMGLDTVPIVDDNFTFPENYEDAILYANGMSKLSQTSREGIVFVSKNPSQIDNGRKSFKIISNKFMLKHGE